MAIGPIQLIRQATPGQRRTLPLGEGFTKASNVFMRLQRRVTLIEKSYKDAFAELQRLQGNRQPEAAPQPKPTKGPTTKLASFPNLSPGPTSPVASPGPQPSRAEPQLPSTEPRLPSTEPRP